MQNFATPIDPSSVQVTPGGGLSTPAFSLALNSSAAAGQLFELIFRFQCQRGCADGRVHFAWDRPSVTGDGAVTGILDVCAGGSFLGIEPIGCSGTPRTPSRLPSIRTLSSPVRSTSLFPASSMSLSISPLTAASPAPRLWIPPTVSVTTPEPSTLLLMTASWAVWPLSKCAGAALLIHPGGIACGYYQRILATLLAALIALPAGFPANHREAPITALDHKADITDVFAFRSYTAAGPTAIRWSRSSCASIRSWSRPMVRTGGPSIPTSSMRSRSTTTTTQWKTSCFNSGSHTEQRLPNLFQVYAGAGGGIVAPANSPAPVPPGTLIVPPQITSFSSPGLGQRQSYTVTMIKGGVSTPITGAGSFFAVPSNVGPRTMDYNALFNAGTYTTNHGQSQGVRRNRGRSVLDRPGRRVRHAEPALCRQSRPACCRRRRTPPLRTSPATRCPATRSMRSPSKCR